MANQKIPIPQDDLFNQMLDLSAKSVRNRYCHILHKKGAEFNKVFNLMRHDSYMQPHMHPGEEKIEKIHIIKGSLCFFFFDEKGNIKEKIHLESKGKNFISVPAFSWHTYVMKSEIVLTYETMMGKYNPQTWKRLADWAPSEQSHESYKYFKELKNSATK